MVRVGRARLEFQVLIPNARLIVFGVDKKRSDTGNVGGLSGPEQSILEECLAQASSLLRPVNRKASEQHYWNRMSGQPPAYPAGSFRVLNRADSKTVIANNTPTSPTNDIGLRTASLLVDQCKPLQKAIKRLFSTLKGVDIVRFVELLDRGISFRFRCHSSTLFPAINRARRGFSVTGRLSTS